MSIFICKRKSATIVLTIIMSCFSGISLAADLYQVIDLGKLGEVLNDETMRSAEAFSINDSGYIVGNASDENPGTHAFIYQNNSMTELGYLEHFVLSTTKPKVPIEEPSSFAFGLNDLYAVGYSLESEVTEITAADQSISYTISNTEWALFYDISNLAINRIPQFVPDAPQNARAVAINNNNLVVGTGLFDPADGNDTDGNELTGLYRRGFFYNIDTDSLLMVAPLEGVNSKRNIRLRAVNDTGLAVGLSGLIVDEVGSVEVVLVDVNDPETVEKIEIFGKGSQTPWAINNAGKIVGFAINNSKVLEAFVYDTEIDTVTGLGFLNDKFKDSEAFDINESDQIVGLSQVQNSPSVYHAFLYENNTLKDINKLISCEDSSAWQLNEARSINDSGVITGTGVFEGEIRAYMLMPIAGSAPNCGDDSSGDSGSVPVISVLLLTILAWGRRKNQSSLI